MEIAKELASIAGEQNVFRDSGTLCGYFRTPVDTSRLVAVAPGSTEEVCRIVRACRDSRTALYTTYDTFFPQDTTRRGGVLLDFRRMNRIERIDSKNLCVHIQRGVTFEQIEKALAPEGLTVLKPAAATTRSVVCHAVSRGMNLAAAKYPEVQASNLQVVLEDGEIHRTGSHANSEEMADWKEDGGPNLSKWYLGADDVFGIVVRASIWVYPRFEGRRFGLFGFQKSEPALGLLRNLPRKELPQECLVLDRQSFSSRFAETGRDALPPWILLTGVEAFAELAEYQHRKIREAAIREGGIEIDPELAARVGSSLDSPWYADPDRQTAFYTLFSRVPEFEALLSRTLSDAGLPPECAARTYVAHGLGRAVWCQYEIGGGDGRGLLERLEGRLVSTGAYYDRPQGRLAEHIYGTIPAWLGHVRKIKNMMDPGRIFNPGRPVPEV